MLLFSISVRHLIDGIVTSSLLKCTFFSISVRHSVTTEGIETSPLFRCHFLYFCETLCHNRRDWNLTFIKMPLFSISVRHFVTIEGIADRLFSTCSWKSTPNVVFRRLFCLCKKFLKTWKHDIYTNKFDCISISNHFTWNLVWQQMKKIQIFVRELRNNFDLTFNNACRSTSVDGNPSNTASPKTQIRFT
jgi:hypothetical protein